MSDFYPGKGNEWGILRQMKWWIIALTFLPVMPVSVVAQEPPSENDLFAGYCFGVTVVRAGFLKIAAAGSCQPRDKECEEFRAKSGIEEEVERARRERYSRYLRARGLFDAPGDSPASKGTNEAMSEGTKDVRACMTSRQQTACEALQKCSDPTRLPF